jgi:putative salt-induced outer membrane protein
MILRPTAAALAFVLALLAALAAPEAARAQDTDSVRVTTDLGLVDATGNTDVTTFNVGEELLGAAGAWGFKQTFGVVYGRTDGETSASLWRASARADRTLASRFGVYVIGAFDRNRFAGISRRFEEGAGVVVKVVQSDANLLELEAGGGLTQQRSITDETKSFASARAAATYRRSFSEESHAQLSVEVLPNLEDSDDVRTNAALELVAPLSQRIAMKLSYVLRYDNLPEPGFEKSDRIFTAGVQVVF